METRLRTPLWFTLLTIIAMLPVLACPTLLNMAQPDTPARTFAYLYPAYVLLAGWLAYLCYPRRPAIAWMILILLLLTHAAIWVLTLYR